MLIRDTWIEQNKSSQALTAKIPRLPGQLLENSQTCRTGVQRTQRIFLSLLYKNNRESSRKRKSVKKKYKRQPILIKIKTPNNTFGTVLKFTQSGRVFLTTAFANTEKGIDAWIKQNKSSRVHPASTPGSSGQLLENSQTCRTGVQATQRIFLSLLYKNNRESSRKRKSVKKKYTQHNSLNKTAPNNTLGAVMDFM